MARTISRTGAVIFQDVHFVGIIQQLYMASVT
jgi:hypothetical protein